MCVVDERVRLGKKSGAIRELTAVKMSGGRTPPMHENRKRYVYRFRLTVRSLSLVAQALFQVHKRGQGAAIAQAVLPKSSCSMVSEAYCLITLFRLIELHRKGF